MIRTGLFGIDERGSGRPSVGARPNPYHGVV